MSRTRSAAFALAAALSLGNAVPPRAAEHANAKAPIGEMDLTSTAIPVIWQGRLVNYIFVKLRLTLARGRDALDYRPKLPYVRDALVRDAHRTPFVRPGDYNHVDEAALKRAVLAEAFRLIGPGVVISATVTSQSPARLAGLPPRSSRARSPIP